MQTFSDSLGRKWGLKIVYSHLGRLKAIGCDLDALCDGAGEKFFDGFLSLPVVVRIAAFWELCEREAKAKSIDEGGFGDGFDGDALDAATVAFMGAVVDFFRKPAMAQLLSRLPKIMQTATTQIGAKIDDALSTLNDKSSGSPENPELIRGN